MTATSTSLETVTIETLASKTMLKTSLSHVHMKKWQKRRGLLTLRPCWFLELRSRFLVPFWVLENLISEDWLNYPTYKRTTIKSEIAMRCTFGNTDSLRLFLLSYRHQFKGSLSFNNNQYYDLDLTTDKPMKHGTNSRFKSPLLRKLNRTDGSKTIILIV